MYTAFIVAVTLLGVLVLTRAYIYLNDNKVRPSTNIVEAPLTEVLPSFTTVKSDTGTDIFISVNLTGGTPIASQLKSKNGTIEGEFKRINEFA